MDDHIETTSLTAGVDGGRGMAIDDMGRIVVGGIAGADMGVVRYLADGTLDAAFDGPSGTGNGKFAIDVSGTDTGEDMKIDTQGRIVISGNTNGATDFAVIRLNEADGTLDSTFGTGGKVIVSFTGGATTEKDKALMVQTDGRIVVAGQSGSNFAVERISGGGTRYYVMQDANWNVTGVADGAGNVVERYQYDPYGKVTVLNANFSTDADNTQDINEPFLFQGLRSDANSGNYNARNRDLRPTLGSFIQADPSGYTDGTNLYRLEGANPIFHVDPLGFAGEIPATQPSTLSKEISLLDADWGDNLGDPQGTMKLDVSASNSPDAKGPVNIKLNGTIELSSAIDTGDIGKGALYVNGKKAKVVAADKTAKEQKSFIATWEGETNTDEKCHAEGTIYIALQWNGAKNPDPEPGTKQNTGVGQSVLIKWQYDGGKNGKGFTGTYEQDSDNERNLSIDTPRDKKKK